MAVYNKLVPVVAAYDFTATISASTATTVTIALTDGTSMVLSGTAFVVSGGQMTAGSISSMTHKSAVGADLETFTGIGNFSAVTFQSLLTPTVNSVAIFANILVAGDNLTGNSGADVLLGYSGNDFIRGLAGNDTIDGGLGEDTASYDNDASNGGTAGVVVNLSANAVNFGGAVAAGTARDGFGNTDTLISIEDARGTAQADVFVGGTGLSFFQGRGGADTYITNVVQYADNYYSNGFGWVDYQGDGGAAGISVDLAAGTATDSYGNAESLSGITSIRGTNLADTITGNQYYNQFQSLGGADTIDGGGGYDRVAYDRDQGAGGTAAVTVDLAAGTATDGFGAADTLISIEQVVGTNFADNISGNAWDNFLVGGFGNDILVGRDGFDTLRPGLGTDTVDGSVGTNVDQGYDDRDQLDYSDTGPDGSGLGVIVNLSTAAITHETFTVLGNTARDTGGSTDTLIDIERIRGTNGRDYFRGSDTANLREEIFRGMGGDDYIHGGAGYNIVRYQGDTADYGGLGAGGTSGVIVNLSASSITVGLNTVLAGTARDAFGNTDTLVNIRGVRGTGLADHVVGGSGFDFFRSLGGADFFDGGAGARDTIEFFMDDLFFGITGVGFTIDMVPGTALNFYDNTTTTFVNVEDVNGSERNDTITGNGLANRINGDTGNDIINGGAGDDILTGGAGNDTLDGGADFDIVSYLYDPGYGVYNNLQRADSFPTAWGGVNANLGTGIATDFAGNTDTLVLGTIEGLTGTFFNDTLTGDSANNIFYGLSGNDTIDGAGGSDTVSYANWGNTSGNGAPDLIGINASRPNGVTVTLAAVGAGSGNDSEGGTDTLISIENVVGSTGNDTITGSAVDNVLNGGDGADTLSGLDGVDTLLGGAGNDTLDGGTGIDLLYGGTNDDIYIVDELNDTIIEFVGEGTDTVRSAQTNTFMFNTNLENMELLAGGLIGWGNAGNNVMTGNASNNVFIAGDGADTVNGLDGDDVILGGLGGDILNGGNNNDQLWGGDGDDQLNGGDGNDVLIGGAGTNTMTGGLGDDTYFVDSLTDVVVEAAGAGTGNDTAWVSVSGVTITSNVESVILVGTATNVTGSDNSEVLLANGALASTVDGKGGNDTIWGSLFGDTLIGGTGNDVLSGLAGADTFGFAAPGFGFDIINDFSGIAGGQNDRIDLRGMGIANFAALSFTQYGVGTTVNFGADGILLWNIVATNLQAGDFIFS